MKLSFKLISCNSYGFMHVQHAVYKNMFHAGNDYFLVHSVTMQYPNMQL